LLLAIGLGYGSNGPAIGRDIETIVFLSAMQWLALPCSWTPMGPPLVAALKPFFGNARTLTKNALVYILSIIESMNAR
jgi:hypothetical protein